MATRTGIKGWEYKMNKKWALLLDFVLSTVNIIVYKLVMDTTTLSSIGSTIRLSYPWFIVSSLLLTVFTIILATKHKDTKKILAIGLVITNSIFLAWVLYLYLIAIKG